jgi:hypothetical protein
MLTNTMGTTLCYIWDVIFNELFMCLLCCMRILRYTDDLLLHVSVHFRRCVMCMYLLRCNRTLVRSIDTSLCIFRRCVCISIAVSESLVRSIDTSLCTFRRCVCISIAVSESLVPSDLLIHLYALSGAVYVSSSLYPNPSFPATTISIDTSPCIFRRCVCISFAVSESLVPSNDDLLIHLCIFKRCVCISIAVSESHVPSNKDLLNRIDTSLHILRRCICISFAVSESQVCNNDGLLIHLYALSGAVYVSPSLYPSHRSPATTSY